MIDVVGFLERQARVAAVDARAAGINEVFDRVVAAGFEDVEEAGDVRADVLVRVDQRIAHPGLRGEMHDSIELLGSEELIDIRAVGDVELVE